MDITETNPGEGVTEEALVESLLISEDEDSDGTATETQKDEQAEETDTEDNTEEEGEESDQESEDEDTDEENDTDSDEEESEEDQVGLEDDDQISWEQGDETISVTGKELREGYLRQSDYTRKTQELAKETKTVTEMQAALAQEYQSIAGGVEVELQRFADVNWDQLEKDDPVAFNEKRTEFLELKAKQQEAQERATELQSEAQKKQLEELEAYVNEQGELVQSLIPDFADPEKAKQLTTDIKEYALSIGVSEEEFGQVVDARQWVVLHDAMRFRKAQEAASKKKESVKPKIVKSKKAAQGKDDAKATGKKARDKFVKSGSDEDAIDFLLTGTD